MKRFIIPWWLVYTICISVVLLVLIFVVYLVINFNQAYNTPVKP